MGGSNAGRSVRSATVVRGAVSAAAVVLLIGVALAAGGVGPWVARPLTNPPSAPTRAPTLPSITAPRRSSAAQTSQGDSNGPLGWAIRLVVIAVIAAVVVLALWWVAGRVRDLARERQEALRGDAPPELMVAQEPPPLRAEAAGRDFDPRAAADAIISCWLWVEKAATARGLGRKSQDTPTEFLARLTDRQSGLDRIRIAADVLLPLYQRARFDHVALTPDAAVRAREAAGVLCGAPVADPADSSTDPAAHSAAGPTAGVDG